MRTIYRPDGTAGKNIAQLALNNVSIIQLPCVTGFYPQLNGSGLYVLRSDFPVTLALTENESPLTSAYIAKAGARIQTNFSGLSVSAPDGVSGVIEIALLKNGADFDAPLSTACANGAQAVRIDTNTGAVLAGVLYVPPGVSVLRKLAIATTGTTITGSFIRCAFNSGVMTSGSNITDRRNGVNFNVPAIPLDYGVNSTPYPNTVVARFSEFPIYARANQLSFQIEGTGLSTAALSVSQIFE